MTKKILIAYASHYGSTEQVAQTIAEELIQRGQSVELQPVQQVTGLSAYDALVLGSAVRYGQWLPEALTFVNTHRAEIQHKPAVLFTVHILNTGSDPESQTARSAYLNTVRSIVKPAAEAFFAGKIDFGRMTVFDRMLCKLIKSPVGDLRDWPAIRTWSQAVFA
ncbi:MAG: flavodoxin domain-containing protein [Anaerolineaceae bacterium]|nr:flavodoxin domain-containing protein [Anaerolineaceae bacterium]